MKIEKFMDSDAQLFTLQNKNGMEVALTDIGGTIVNIIVPDKNGAKVDVLLGYESPQRYLTNSSAHGAIVGRFANRIGGASFTLEGKTYKCDQNEGKNVLHGGNSKYFHRMWKAEANEAKNSVTFSLTSPDGDQGMPGTAEISVTYSLDDNNALSILYNAVSDKATFFNLTNHSYFNLDGHDAGPVADQILQMDCSRFSVIDSEFIPTGELRSVEGTPMDFRTPKKIGRDENSDYEQVVTGNGFDHNFVIDHPGFDKPFATAKSEKTGIVMKVFTDLPGVQFYAGNNMGTDYGEKGGAKYVRRGAFCLETQFYPDTPNKPDFPGSLYKAGEKLVSKTIYQFSAE